MKKGLKTLAILFASFVSLVGVNAATETKAIDTNACETVYTNYYFLLEAETVNYMESKNLSTLTHVTMGTYNNNVYNNAFDSKNVGYGQVAISRSTETSSDKIASMSLYDYYNAFKKANQNENGVYKNGTANYIVGHSWSKYQNGTWIPMSSGLDVTGFGENALINATMDANSSIIRTSTISSSDVNPFSLQITRSGYSSLSGNPINVDGTDWYLHPAVYYVQYCSTAKKTVEYDGNAENVENVPEKDVFDQNECTNISKVTPERTGYTFLGWSTDKDAKEADTTYTPGKIYCGESIKLYAIWKENVKIENTYSIVYKANTTDVVSNMPNSVTKKTSETALIATEIPVREGYTFLGWSTDSNDTLGNDAYKGGSEYTDKKDLTLYAIWKKKTTVVLPENPKTGIESYILPFGGVALASLGAIVGLKKRKSYLQF